MSPGSLLLWTDLLLHGTVKASLLLALGLAAVVLGSRLSAAVRHLILTCALAAAVGTPLLWVLVPGWGPDLASEIATSERPTPVTSGTLTASPAGPDAARPVGRAPGDPPAGPLADTGWRRLLFVLWSGGALLLALRGLRARRARRRLERASQPVKHPRLQTLMRSCALELGLDRPVELLESPIAIGPMAWGLWRSRIVLPAGAEEWPSARLRVVLLHELAHLRRHDAWSSLLAEVAVALLWFDPLVWIAARRLSDEAERACDDLVLERGVRPSRYLDELVGLVRDARRRLESRSVLALSSPRGLDGRAAALVATGCSRRAPSALQARVALAVAVLLAVPLAGLGKGATTAPGGEKMHDSRPSPAVPREETVATFDALRSAAEREAFLGELVDQEPDAVPVVLALAPELHVDAALASILHRVLAQGLDSTLLGPFVATMGSLEADAARQEVVIELVSTYQLPERVMLDVIRAVDTMRAEAARTDSLLALARHQPLSVTTAAVLRHAASRLDRPSSRRAVLRAIAD